MSVEVTFTSDIAGGGGDDAAEVGMRGSETGGFVGDEGGASDITGVKRMVVVSVIGCFAFADDG